MATPRLWVPGERQASNCSYQYTTAKSVEFFTLRITKEKFMIRIGFVPSDSAVFQVLTICFGDMQRMIRNSEVRSNEITIHELHYKITNI